MFPPNLQQSSGHVTSQARSVLGVPLSRPRERVMWPADAGARRLPAIETESWPGDVTAMLRARSAFPTQLSKLAALN